MITVSFLVVLRIVYNNDTDLTNPTGGGIDELTNPICTLWPTSYGDIKNTNAKARNTLPTRGAIAKENERKIEIKGRI